MVHIELHTGDSGAAAAFFDELLGWEAERVGPYLSVSPRSRIGGRIGAGVGAGVVECGAFPAQWVPYVLVDSAEQATAHAERLGASILVAPSRGASGCRSVITSVCSGAIALWEPHNGRRR